MASPAVSQGYGITVSFGAAHPWNSKGIAQGDFEITDINWDGIDAEPIEVTHMASGPGVATNTFGNRTYIPNDLVDPGSLQVEAHFNPDKVPPFNALLAMELVWPDGAKWAGNGMLASLSAASPMDDKMTASLTIKFSGPITRTAAPAPSG